MLKARTGQGQCWVWPHTPLSYRQTARRWSGKRAAKPTAGVWLPWLPGLEAIALWLSVWTRRCMRIRGTFDRAGPGSGAGRGARRATILTRTDRGGETLSIWRFGSDYGSAVLSNLWYPDRLNTARLGFIQG